MTAGERERRIEAAARLAFGFASPTRWDTVAVGVQKEYRRRAAEILDAADEVVPVVSRAEMQRRSRIDHEAAEREHERS